MVTIALTDPHPRENASMLSHVQLMARGVPVAAARLRHEGLDPLDVDAAGALSVLQYHPGPIGDWATQCSTGEFDRWCVVWRSYQWMRKRELGRLDGPRMAAHANST